MLVRWLLLARIEARETATSRSQAKRLFLTALFVATALGASPAAAEVSGTIAASTQDIYRGIPTSRGDPSVTLGLHQEKLSGFYLGGTLSAAFHLAHPRLTSGSQYVGYAKAIGRTTIDLGMVHRSFRKGYSDEYASDFVEAFGGLSRGGLTVRAFLSPNLVHSRPAAYTETDFDIYARRGWSASGHAGLLLSLNHGPSSPSETRLDTTLRVEKALGSLSLGVELSLVASKDVVETPRLAGNVHFAF
jgi:uncharacterized protein (TIGR02001 family)